MGVWPLGPLEISHRARLDLPCRHSPGVGATYLVSARGGGSGSPVMFSVDPPST
jgi:hypothetical protein